MSSIVFVSHVLCLAANFSFAGYKVQSRSFSSHVPPWFGKRILVGFYFHDNTRVRSKQNKQTSVYYLFYLYLAQQLLYILLK